MDKQTISISMPPFPSFIEGNYTTFSSGEMHVHRHNIGFFDLIFVKKGTLFLQENTQKYTVHANEMFILLPDAEHFSWKPCEETTSFFWMHIYTTSRWQQSDFPVRFVSELPIPELHFHQKSYTLQLPKLGKITEPDLIFNLLNEIQKSTDNVRIDSIWYTEELFLKFLKYIDNRGILKDRTTLLAEKVHLYLEEHLEEHIDNKILSNEFHLHVNYIARVMTNVYGKTAMELLEEMRIETAKQYLIHTNKLIKNIAELVGFETYVSFTSRFKKLTGMSPKAYRVTYKK
ncbi:AraC family transcriptional regulator [Weissella bombi]|uniref:AraC-type DNA-binding protein n=1 Tax=Weissella bombi TaxID=1505725 RepID=A0A1C4A728_9LACO|nr:AraC family transcriptional regulator [Weissella bombi]SCB90469.1 AraC-type DNA-binding protein [Weissella bombi]